MAYNIQSYAKSPNRYKMYLFFIRWKGDNIRGKKPKAVKQLDLNNKVIAEYPSIAEASRSTGIIKSSILHCLAGRYHKAGGYRWIYS